MQLRILRHEATFPADTKAIFDRTPGKSFGADQDRQADFSPQITQFIVGTFLATTYLFLRVPELAVPDMARQAGKCLTDEGARFA